METTVHAFKLLESIKTCIWCKMFSTTSGTRQSIDKLYFDDYYEDRVCDDNMMVII